MFVRKVAVHGRLWLFGLIALFGLAEAVHAQPRGEIGLQGSFSDVFDRLDDAYRGGPGFNFFGAYHLSRSFDIRGDFGVRFLEGEDVAIHSHMPAPDLGSYYGERTGDFQIIPSTLDLVYRFENVSKGRFWVPFVAAGLGFYDMQLTYFAADSLATSPDSKEGRAAARSGGDEFDNDFSQGRKENVVDFGWNAKAGVNFYRTSQLFLNLEAGTHFINTRRRWTPMYDVSIGIGLTLPVRSSQ